METNFNFNSAVCTSREQSEKLLSLGLKKETADMVWHFTHSRSQGLQWELEPHAPITKNNCHFNIDRLNVFGRKKADGTLMTGEEYFNDIWGKDIPAWTYIRLAEIILRSGANGCVCYTTSCMDEPFKSVLALVEFYIKSGKINKEYLV